MFEEKKTANTFDNFKIICLENIERMERLYNYVKDNDIRVSGKVIWDDARSIKKCELIERGNLDRSTVKNYPSQTIDLIVTSPPYINAQKYTRSLSLEMYWLGHWQNPEDRAVFDARVIGSERVSEDNRFIKDCNIPLLRKELLRIATVNQKRSAIVNAFFEDLFLALKECHRLLKIGGYLVLVIGNNKIFGKEIPTHRIVIFWAKQLQFKLELVLYDDIKSWGLMTKRNYTADIITREWILVFKKGC